MKNVQEMLRKLNETSKDYWRFVCDGRKIKLIRTNNCCSEFDEWVMVNILDLKKTLWKSCFFKAFNQIIENNPKVKLKIYNDFFLVKDEDFNQRVVFDSLLLIEYTELLLDTLQLKYPSKKQRKNRRKNMEGIKELKELEEIKELYGEEESDGTRLFCVGCMFTANEGCDFSELEDDEGRYICEDHCDKNITNKSLILTKEQTERSICRLIRLSSGEWEMELLGAK